MVNSGGVGFACWQIFLKCWFFHSTFFVRFWRAFFLPLFLFSGCMLVNITGYFTFFINSYYNMHGMPLFTACLNRVWCDHVRRYIVKTDEWLYGTLYRGKLKCHYVCCLFVIGITVQRIFFIIVCCTVSVWYSHVSLMTACAFDVCLFKMNVLTKETTWNLI